MSSEVDDILDDLERDRIKRENWRFDGQQHRSDIIPPSIVLTGDEKEDWIPHWMNNKIED